MPTILNEYIEPVFIVAVIAVLVDDIQPVTVFLAAASKKFCEQSLFKISIFSFSR